jgi:gp54 protein|nr:MAG TPA: NinG recombination protein [Caudoviricetes sp.]
MNKYLIKFDIDFYQSKEWRDKRDEILKRDNFECQKCKGKGRYSKAITVHHIKHYKKYPSLALTDSNLISLCNQCHNEEHPEKLKELIKNKKPIHKERWR